MEGRGGGIISLKENQNEYFERIEEYKQRWKEWVDTNEEHINKIVNK